MEINEISIPVSPGELIDKITILEIKSKMMTQKDKLLNVMKELEILNSMFNQLNLNDDFILECKSLLHEFNFKIWEIEDNIRKKESVMEFDDEFISLARKIYVTNDKRAETKKKINSYLNSPIVEEKSYEKY